MEIDDNEVALEGTINVPPLNAPVTGTATAPGNLVLTGTTMLIMAASGGTWILADTELSVVACITGEGPCVGAGPLPLEEARISGSLDVFGTTVPMEGEIADPLNFESEPITVNIDGYTLSDTEFSLGISTGMVATGTISLPNGSAIVSGKIDLNADTTLEGGKNLPLLTNPALTGDVNLIIPAQGATYVGGPASISHENISLSGATWSMTPAGAISFEGTRPSSVDLGTICEPDPATQVCETCSEVVCTQTCWSPFGSYCCATTLEEWDCNCSVSDYCAEFGNIACDVLITGGDSGFNASFEASCVQGSTPSFDTTIPSNSGEVCVDGGGPVGTQCGTLW